MSERTCRVRERMPGANNVATGVQVAPRRGRPVEAKAASEDRNERT